ncbi:NAD(P)-binding protein [Vulcanococcus limneticus]|uniref:NAD(P)-binding protein n=1 Tax=Vulcanococcus limneticus TaxID=2170428 RepID=UPI00398BCA38
MSSPPHPAAGPGGSHDPGSFAVIGAGAAGCACVAALRRQGWAGPISLWESGRGPGGRTATRRSRTDAGLRIDHGAPLFNLTASPPPALLEPLLAGGWIEPWTGPIAQLDGQGQLHPGGSAPHGLGSLYRGNGGMEHLCRGLLEQAGADVEIHYGQLVRHLEITPERRWRLLGPDRQLLKEVDWLVLSGTLLAHPRSRLLLDWSEVPLAAAARRLQDAQLQHVLAVLASIQSEARSNLLLLVPAAAAAPWRKLPFRLLEFSEAAQLRWNLSRLSVQPLADGRCAVVAHSSATFASEHLSVYGSRSSIASQLGVAPRPEQEQAVIEALSAALRDALGQALGRWLSEAALRRSLAGERQLMRWGAAFPRPPGLPLELALCPASRLGFCGDYVAGPGFGRVEGALRSAEALAGRLLAAAAGGSPAAVNNHCESSRGPAPLLG